MASGLDALKHIVVLMMENRSFDHMLGSLKAVDARIDGVTNELSNPDTTGATVKPLPLAEFRGNLTPIPTTIFRRSTCRYLAGTRARIVQRTCRGS